MAKVSIHAPARGATAREKFNKDMHLFQFTRPQGARHRCDGLAELRDCVSIHAPARGATASRSNQRRRSTGFNSRARKGRNLIQLLISIRPTGFNSRARKGRDADTRPRLQVHKVSIHAPARGATYNHHQTSGRWKVSIHAPARGAT